MIRCNALRWGAPGQPLTPAIDIELGKGSLTGVIGANGSGKSSLLKVIAGLQKPLAGNVTLQVPRRGGLSFLPQQQHLDRQFPISLQELVAAGFWAPSSPRNNAANACKPCWRTGVSAVWNSAP